MFYTLAINSNNQIFAGTYDGVFRSTDDGESWVEKSNGLGSWDIRSLAINSLDYIFAGTWVNTPTNGVFRSTNNGENWTQVGLSENIVFSLAINSNDYIFAGTIGGVYRSTDDGETWSGAGIGVFASVVSLAINSYNYIFAGTDYGYGIFRSTNNGQSWSPVNNGLTAETVTAIAINSDDNVFAATDNNGVFISTNNGDSWTQLNTGLENIRTYSLAINSSDYIFVGTLGSGVSHSVNSTVTEISHDTNTLTKYSLEQNYPNPFNPTTKIKFTLTPSLSLAERVSEGRVRATLKVYDILGREVATLVNEEKPAGEYDVEFNGSNLPSGIYFYQLRAGDPSTSSGQAFTETKKMVLLK
jgi:photosystem II stability/assembly factor-like uncharacterized protein